VGGDHCSFLFGQLHLDYARGMGVGMRIVNGLAWVQEAILTPACRSQTGDGGGKQ